MTEKLDNGAAGSDQPAEKSRRRRNWPLILGLGAVATVAVGGSLFYGGYLYGESQHYQPKVIQVSFECPKQVPFGAYVHTVSDTGKTDEAGSQRLFISQGEIRTDPNNPSVGDFVITLPADTAAISPNFGCGKIAGNNWEHADNTGRWYRLVNWVNKIFAFRCSNNPNTESNNGTGSLIGSCVEVDSTVFGTTPEPGGSQSETVINFAEVRTARQAQEAEESLYPALIA